MPIDALPALRDKRVLVVEDEDLVARELRHDLEDMGAHVLGPVPSVAMALAMLAQADAIDGAILDIDLRGETVFPVAGALHERHVPFVFWTGYDAPALPGAFDDAPCLRKPAPLADVLRLLLGDLARGRPSAPVLADLYVAADGAHRLALRAGGALLDDAGLTWVGAAFVDAREWSRRLHAPLVPGVPVREPWRHLASLRHQLAVMG